MKSSNWIVLPALALSLFSSQTPAKADPIPPENPIRAELRLKRIRFELETITTLSSVLENSIANAQRKNQELKLGTVCMSLGALAQEIPSAYGTTAADDRFGANPTIQHHFRAMIGELLIFYGYCDEEEPHDLGHVPTQSEVRATNQTILKLNQGIRAAIEAAVKP